MAIPENKLRKYNDDTNKSEFPSESKGTKRSYDQMVEAAKLDAEKSPRQKVTSDNAHSIVNAFVQRFNSIMEYAQKHNELTLEDAATRFDQENSDRLLALQLQSKEVAKLLRRDTTTPEKEPTTKKSSEIMQKMWNPREVQPFIPESKIDYGSIKDTLRDFNPNLSSGALEVLAQEKFRLACDNPKKFNEMFMEVDTKKGKRYLPIMKAAADDWINDDWIDDEAQIIADEDIYHGDNEALALGYDEAQHRYLQQPNQETQSSPYEYAEMEPERPNAQEFAMAFRRAGGYDNLPDYYKDILHENPFTAEEAKRVTNALKSEMETGVIDKNEYEKLYYAVQNQTTRSREYESKDSRKAQKKSNNKNEAGQRASKKYEGGKGKDTRAAYEETNTRKNSKKAHNKTPSGRASSEKYRGTEAGKSVKRQYKDRQKLLSSSEGRETLRNDYYSYITDGTLPSYIANKKTYEEFIEKNKNKIFPEGLPEEQEE